jgi:hypothetical protein
MRAALAAANPVSIKGPCGVEDGAPFREREGGVLAGLLRAVELSGDPVLFVLAIIKVILLQSAGGGN